MHTILELAISGAFAMSGSKLPVMVLHVVPLGFGGAEKLYVYVSAALSEFNCFLTTGKCTPLNIDDGLSTHLRSFGMICLVL